MLRRLQSRAWRSSSSRPVPWRLDPTAEEQSRDRDLGFGAVVSRESRQRLLNPDGRGGSVRRYSILPLERNKVTFFPLSWTIVHPIDGASPLAGKTARELEQAQAEILVLLSGTDETFAQTVHARSSYRANEIVWNARFQSIFVQPDGQSHLSVDISRLHDIEQI